MKTPQGLLLWVFGLISCDLQTFVHCFFDVDEINSVNYGIDILDVPVMLGQESEGGSVFLASKFGQQYQCTYQEKSLEDELKQKEEEKVAMEMGIAELLKPMENGPCLINTKGWWTYEFCFGKYIKQYHLEDAKITSATMYLGHYLSDYDWSNTTQLRKQRSWMSRYHTQQYVNGSLCDLTGKGRRAEVRFYCEQTQSDYISRVDETETCVYTIAVQTSRICNHPYLKPPAPTTAVPIACHPVLSEGEYGRYMDMVAAKEEQKITKQRIIEANSVQNMESIIRPPKDGESPTKPSPIDSTPDPTSVEVDLLTPDDLEVGEVAEGSLGDLQRALSKTLMTELKDALGDGGDDVKISKMRIKRMNNPGDIEKAVKDVIENAKKDMTSKGKDQERQGQRSEEGEEVKDDVATETKPEEEEDEDKVMLEEFDKGLDDIAETEGHLKQIKDYKETLEKEINEQFDDILQEAQEELDMDLSDVKNIDTDQAIKTMSETLQKLMKQLENKKLKKAQPITEDSSSASESSSISTKSDPPSTGNSQSTSPTDSSSLANTKSGKDDEDGDLINMEYDLNYGGKEEEKSKPDLIMIEDAPNPKSKEPPPKYKTHIINDGPIKVKVMSRKVEVIDKDRVQKESPKVVKSQLQEAESREHKIQVKIITSGEHYDEATADMLQGGNAINKMIVAVLGGNTDEIKEAQRQEKMESAYGFKWDTTANDDRQTDTTQDANTDRYDSKSADTEHYDNNS